MNDCALDPLAGHKLDAPQRTIDESKSTPGAPQGQERDTSNHRAGGFKQPPFVAWQLCEED